MIHIPRAGGTTIARSILPYLFKIPICKQYKFGKYLSNIFPLKKGVQVLGYNKRFEIKSDKNYSINIPWKHSTAKEIKKHFSKEEWNSCYKVAISKRNVFDRIASYYYHKIKLNNINKNQYSALHNISFKDYIINNMYDKNDNTLNYITNDNGDVIVDYIIDFNNLIPETKKIMSSILNLDIQFIDYKKLPKKNYFELYNKKMMEKIETDFKNELKYFG